VTTTTTTSTVVSKTDFGEGVIATIIYWAIGQAMLVAYVLLVNWVYSQEADKISKTEEVELQPPEAAPPGGASSSSQGERRPSQSTGNGRPRSFIGQIEARGNTAAGLSLAFDLVIGGIAIRTPIRAGFSLVAMIIWVPSVLLVVMPIMHLYLDTLILRAADFKHNILHMKNWGASVLIGSLKLLSVLLLDNLYQANCDTTIYVDTGQCEPPKMPNDLGGRLAVNAVPDVLKWQSLVDIFALLVFMLVAKALFHARFVLRNGLGEASTNFATFSLDSILANPQNNAMAVSLAGYCLGQGLVLVGVSTCFDENIGDHTGFLFAWTAIGMVLMLLSQVINDNLIIMQLDNAAALLDDNLSVALMEAGQFVATGVVIQATMAGGGGDFGESLATTLIFWMLSQVLLLAFTVVYRVLTVFDDLEQIKAANAAAGLGGAMTLLSLALGMAYPIAQYGSIAVFVPVSLTGCFFLVVLRVAIDKFILPGDKLDDEIMQINWGAALIEGAVACAIALITNTYVRQAADFDVCA